VRKLRSKKDNEGVTATTDTWAKLWPLVVSFFYTAVLLAALTGLLVGLFSGEAYYSPRSSSAWYTYNVQDDTLGFAITMFVYLFIAVGAALKLYEVVIKRG
jgi:hypothetical protein